MRIFAVMSVALFVATSAFAQQLQSISDPPNDDFGDGNLLYPQNANFKSGDLDLRQLRVTRDNEGFWFEAQFANPVRNPAKAFDVLGGGNLADFARKGFYNFNIDIYVDTDRINGSGNTFTLPGRGGLRIDGAYAWEKAAILTPRPEAIRENLLDALVKQHPDRSRDEVAASTDAAIFFPTRVRVRGKSVSFFVPQSYFGNSDGSDWAVTVLVTGAQLALPIHLHLLPSAKSPLEELELGVLQPFQGQPAETFGFGNIARSPSPIVDALLPTMALQKSQLSGASALTGVSWRAHAVDGIQPLSAAASIATATDTSPAADSTVVPIGKLFQPESPPAAKAAQAKPAETDPSADPSIVMRLQTLQLLFDQKLIDETEYKEQKQRILKEL